MFNLAPTKRIVIISAEQADSSPAANANASAGLASQLGHGVASGMFDSVIQCDGQYKGTPERSFLVICDANAVRVLTHTAARFSQECILVAVSDADGIGGHLLYADGHTDCIGTLQPCVEGQEYEASTTISGTNIAFHFA